MTKAAALNAFWKSFGIKAYEENSVPTGDDAPNYPYITYELSTDSFMGEVPLSATIWNNSSSILFLNEKAEEISRYITSSGRQLKCDDGAIYIRKGSPFAQMRSEEENPNIKGKYINISAEFITNN